MLDFSGSWADFLPAASRLHAVLWPASFPIIALGAWLGRIEVIAIAALVCISALVASASSEAGALTCGASLFVWSLVCLPAARMRAREKLRRGDARYLERRRGDFELTEALRLARIGSWHWDVESGRMSWSDLMFDIFGLDPSEAVPSQEVRRSLLVPESRERVVEAVEAAVRVGQPFSLELEFVHRSGQQRWVACIGDVLRHESGQVRCVHGTVAEITDRKHIEQALRRSEQQFRASFNATFQFMGMITPDGVLIEANETSVKFTGRPASDQLGKLFWETDWFKSSEALQSRIHFAVQEAAAGQTSRFDLDLKDRFGASRTFDCSVKPVLDVDGRITLLVAEGRDVTSERLALKALADSGQRFRLAMRNAPIGQALIAIDGHWESVNEALCQMLGYSEAALLDKTFEDLIEPDDLVLVQGDAAALVAGHQERLRASLRCRHASGAMLEAQFDLTLLRDRNGKPTQFIAQMQDITEQRRLERERSALTRRLTLAMSVSGIGVWEWDAATGLVAVDDGMCRIYGFPPGERVSYSDWKLTIIPEDVSGADAAMQAALRSEGRQTASFRIRHPRLGVRYIESVFDLMRGPDSELVSVIGVNLDVTDRWLAEQRIGDAKRQLERRIEEVSILQEQLREQAIRDGLTGLYNRRYFDERLETELGKAALAGHAVSLIMADLDHFKSINDRFGHQGGDALLQAWSELLRSNLRGTDVLCRYGGEEFVIVLPGSSLADAETRAEQLRSQFESLVLPAANGRDSIHTTVSIGVAHAAARSRTAEQLIRAADGALYRAKTEGRNRVVCETLL